MPIWADSSGRPPRGLQGYTPVPLDAFTGLEFRSDSQAGWGQALDMADVDLEAGAVRTRDGLDARISQSGAFADACPFGSSVITADGTNLRLWDSAGSVLGTLASTQTGLSVQPIGTTSTTSAYVASQGSTVRKVTPAGTWSSPAGMPAAYLLARQLPDNRLVAARLSTNGSRVQFSGAGNPESWGTDDYVDVGIGDGESITGIAFFNTYLFVFKQTTFYVFYGNSTDSTGGTVFNFRPAQTGLGALQRYPYSNGAAVGHEGVYFIGPDRNVYRTTGGPGAPVGDAIHPFLRGDSVPYFTGLSAPSSEAPEVYAAAGKVYVIAPTSSVSGTFVMDERTGMWTFYSWNAKTVLPLTDSSGFARPGWVPDGNGSQPGRVYEQIEGLTDDDGTAIVSRYRTGFGNLDTGATEEVVREWLLDGYGSPTVKVAVNDGSLDTGAVVTLGTAPNIAQGRRRTAFRGRNFSVQVGASSGAWSVSRLVAHVRGRRPDGTKST